MAIAEIQYMRADQAVRHCSRQTESAEDKTISEKIIVARYKAC
jgi:hypothetical protein